MSGLSGRYASEDKAVDPRTPEVQGWYLRTVALDFATRNNAAGNADSALRDAMQFEDYIKNGRKEEGTNQ